MKHDDISNPRKTLPDFISIFPQFLHLLQLTTGNQFLSAYSVGPIGRNQDAFAVAVQTIEGALRCLVLISLLGEDGVPGFVPVPKDVAVQQFIVPRDPPRKKNPDDEDDPYLDEVGAGK